LTIRRPGSEGSVPSRPQAGQENGAAFGSSPSMDCTVRFHLDTLPIERTVAIMGEKG